MSDTISAFVQQFFWGLGVVCSTIESRVEGSDIFIRVVTDDSHLLIGVHGKNLELIKHLLGRMIEKETQSFVHVHLEVNDYMKAKDERLFRFLDTKIEFVQSSGKTIRIGKLSSFERKKAHHYIAEKHIDGLSTHSEGEGEERSLFLSYTGTTIVPQKPQTPSYQPSSSSSRIDELSEDGVGI